MLELRIFSLLQHLKKYHLIALGKTNPLQQMKAPEQSQNKSASNEKHNNTLAVKKDLQADSIAGEVESIYQRIIQKPSPIIVASFEEATSTTSPKYLASFSALEAHAPVLR